MEKRCKLLEKFSLVQEEYEDLESLKDPSFEKESRQVQSLEAISEKLNSSKYEVRIKYTF